MIVSVYLGTLAHRHALRMTLMTSPVCLYAAPSKLVTTPTRIEPHVKMLAHVFLALAAAPRQASHHLVQHPDWPTALHAPPGMTALLGIVTAQEKSSWATVQLRLETSVSLLHTQFRPQGNLRKLLERLA